MTIVKIYKNKEMSVRSYNVCIDNDIYNVEELIEYYLANKSFKKLRNCGEKSNLELTTICKKFSVNKTTIVLEDKSKKTLLNLTRLQRDVINSFIMVNFNSLSIRSKNALSYYLDKNFSFRNFADKILLNDEFHLEKIKNIGKASIPELESFIKIINEFIHEVSETIEEKKLITLKNGFLLQRIFSISNIPLNILESESIFKLVDFLINNNSLFVKNQNTIFKNSFKIYNHLKEKKLEVIANENNLSAERVRQIRKDCINDLYEKLHFIKSFNDDLFQNYGIDISAKLIDVNENLINNINVLSDTNFSKEFTSYILAVYLSDEFFIIGNIEDVLMAKFSNSKNRHNWKNFYIVNRKFTKVDFLSFANDVNERLNERIDEAYSFNIKSYLSKFINDIDIEVIELALSVAEKILNDEFALYLDLDDNIVFKRNTNKQAYEYAYEALEILGLPSSVEDITQQIIEIHPNYETDENKVRVSMRRKNGFVPIGRSSTFGLKKWENEIEYFKGGTIRSITIEFLERFNTPKHISLISEYISNYREGTYQRSIIDNLKADKSNSFIFLRQGFIGLNSLKENYDIAKYESLPVQLGKTLISLNRRGYSNKDIVHYIKSNYNLNEEESSAIINNLEI